MRIRTALVLLPVLLLPDLHAQTALDRANRRLERLETILRIQDRRTQNDGSLSALLEDADPIIRERAVRAYASIQDTNALGLLMGRLQDPDLAVQRSACLAVGQTALLLSAPARATLERELIWRRLPDIGTPADLLEELGKFGTADGMSDLLIRYGNSASEQHTHGLTMALVRFAIRGVTAPAATRPAAVSCEAAALLYLTRTRGSCAVVLPPARVSAVPPKNVQPAGAACKA